MPVKYFKFKIDAIQYILISCDTERVEVTAVMLLTGTRITTSEFPTVNVVLIVFLETKKFMLATTELMSRN